MVAVTFIACYNASKQCLYTPRRELKKRFLYILDHEGGGIDSNVHWLSDLHRQNVNLPS